MATHVRIGGVGIANLEGQIARLANKAGIGALDAKIESLRAEIGTIRWIVGIAIPAAIAITGFVVGIVVQL